MSFGQRLKQARKEAKLTQEQVAKRLGLDYSTISKYENNHSEPDNETLAKMAEIYNVKVDYLITGHTDDPSPLVKKDKRDELTTIMYHKWDQLDERRRKQALKLIEILEQEADEENSKN
ncbi:helix-turn-helix domain-containing protein [Brevibacillus borstelensis]|uniref:helix-turn-helix domain-containing protein n=1 Tax=Brevibacillus borstelensis TaxID=45462 RepID=UPI0020421B26|nr:helix-turn-helix transcriptional regulator [Brevibacillus borstelensis]MCM3560636.1 helix-turn-helix domain-containing protein [Brevibacillus borstelensis]